MVQHCTANQEIDNTGDRQRLSRPSPTNRNTGHNAPYIVCSVRFETWWQCSHEMLCDLLEGSTPLASQLVPCLALVITLQSQHHGNPP